jgi:2-methylcitrate dehydratase
VRHALIALTGEMGYRRRSVRRPGAFRTSCSKGKALSYPQASRTMMENVVFKISYPAEFHAHTAVEAAMTLHPQVASPWTRSSASSSRRRNRRAHHRQDRKLANPADRDHCIQYIGGDPLIFGRLTAADY